MFQPNLYILTINRVFLHYDQVNILFYSAVFRKFVVMKQKIIFSFLLLCSVVFLYACCKAGTGGKATINCHVVNTNTGGSVNNTIVYVYYGSSKPPATLDKFDDHKSTGVNGSTVSFTGMKCGTYYLYAVGYDSAATLPLKGGGPFSLLHSQRNKTESATISVSY
jgi:hypothetical protein